MSDLDLIRARMKIAYGKGRFVWPWQRWRCDHDRVRCIHGDEIIFGTRHGERSRCLDCGKALPDLPFVCFFTDKPHTRRPRGR